MLLLFGGLWALLYAVRLGEAALRVGASPFGRLGVPDTPAGRAWFLVGGIVVLLVLAWLVLREHEDTLWLADGSGGVLVAAEALESAVQRAAAGHADVVRCDPRLRARHGALEGTVRVYGRPLADAGRLAADVETLLRRRLELVVGTPPARLSVRTRVLSVGQLKRYLP